MLKLVKLKTLMLEDQKMPNSFLISVSTIEWNLRLAY